VNQVDCDEIDELLGGYALTALDELDEASVHIHLAGCDRHQRTVEELSTATDRLMIAVPEREPRPELRVRIFDAIRAEASLSSVSLGWSKERLALGSHACVFHSDESGLKGTMAFLRGGLDKPEEFGVVFADHKRFASLGSWLQEGYAGSIRNLLERGKLAMIPGAATSEDLIAAIGARLDRAIAEGYTVIRLLGFIGWDQPGWPDTASIVEFEHRVNQVVRSYPVAVVCTYDVSRLGGVSVMEGGLRNHPITIMGSRVIRENPFYLAA
jgi:hypothetical protein